MSESAHDRIPAEVKILIPLIIVGLGVGAGAAEKAPGPRIEVAEKEYHFGRVSNDRSVEHVFEVRNTGSKPLVISRVRSSCGCTAAMMETSVIKPGESGKLRLNFNARRQKGTVKRSVSLHSNDPDAPIVSIAVIAEIVQPGQEDEPPKPVKRAHPKMEKLVFEAKCLKCHGPARKRETGRALFATSCAECHGKRGEGKTIEGEKIGPALNIAKMSVKTPGGIRQVITGGTGHPWMPGFGKRYGGPLTESQISSLAKIIREGFPER